MSTVGVFAGAALGLPDKNGRVSLPAGLRNSIPGDPRTRQLYITTHESSPCLIGSGVERKSQIMDTIERIADRAATAGQLVDLSELKRRMFGPGAEVPIDASGRFIIPLELKAEYDWKSDEVFFYGSGDYFEIWNIELLQQMDDPSVEIIQRSLRAHLRAKAEKDAGK